MSREGLLDSNVGPDVLHLGIYPEDILKPGQSSYFQYLGGPIVNHICETVLY